MARLEGLMERLREAVTEQRAPESRGCGRKSGVRDGRSSGRWTRRNRCAGSLLNSVNSLTPPAFWCSPSDQCRGQCRVGSCKTSSPTPGMKSLASDPSRPVFEAIAVAVQLEDARKPANTLPLRLPEVSPRHAAVRNFDPLPDGPAAHTAVRIPDWRSRHQLPGDAARGPDGARERPVGSGVLEGAVYRLRVLGQWFDGIRFYAAASSPRRSRRTWAGLR